MTQLRLRDGITLYFCRHGETQANVQKRFQGRTADSPLTDAGREQARTIAAILKREVADPSTLAYVCSPFPRAVTTMHIIRETMGLPRDGFTTDARLQEINLGSWDGLTDAEARALDPVFFEKRGKDKWNVRVPGGGENYEDVARRATDWVNDLRADTFAVSHGAFTRILRGMFQGLDWEAMSALDEQQGVVFRVRGSDVMRLEAK
jgi:broad specificity phosphatase PhoE